MLARRSRSMRARARWWNDAAKWLPWCLHAAGRAAAERLAAQVQTSAIKVDGLSHFRGAIRATIRLPRPADC